MVALHNHKLTAKDLWPGLPWDNAGMLRVQEAIHDAVIADGVDPKSPQYIFARGRKYEEYMSMFPRFGERQQIMRRIYPPSKANQKSGLTAEEIEYLICRLGMANDPVGQSIVNKLQGM